MPEGPEVKRITERINDFFQDTTLESIEVVVPRYGEKQLRGEWRSFNPPCRCRLNPYSVKVSLSILRLKTVGLCGTL